MLVDGREIKANIHEYTATKREDHAMGDLTECIAAGRCYSEPRPVRDTLCLLVNRVHEQVDYAVPR